MLCVELFPVSKNWLGLGVRVGAVTFGSSRPQMSKHLNRENKLGRGLTPAIPASQEVEGGESLEFRRRSEPRSHHCTPAWVTQ